MNRSHLALLRAIAAGDVLKSHRDIEGRKFYKLHALDGSEQEIAPGVVEYLSDHRLIDSNKKFPAATFWLTETGKSLVEKRLS